MPENTSEARPSPKSTKRVSFDLSLEMHRRLRQWAADVGIDAASLQRALLGLALNDPELAARAERELGMPGR